MGIITPQTDIYFISDIKLTPNYTDTIAFNSKEEQTEYFMSKSIFHVTNATYQRNTASGSVSSGAVRVEMNYLLVPQVSYIAFINRGHDNKWFYAFVDSWEYINNNCVEFSYTLDILQSYWFDFKYESCLVEREHVQVDEDIIGAFTYPENVETGELICNTNDTIDLNPDGFSIGMLMTEDVLGESVGSDTYGNVFSGLKFTQYKMATDLPAIRETLELYASQGKSDNIVSIYQIPSFCYNITGAVNEVSKAFGMSTELNGYIPKNKKLYTNEFHRLLVTTNNGQYGEFAYELFGNSTPTFDIIGVSVPKAEILIRPKFYKGIALDYDDSLVISNFPQCSWTSPYYANWLAQNEGIMNTATINQTLSSISTLLIAMATRNPTIATGAGVLGVTNAINRERDVQTQYATAKAMPSGAKGSFTSGNLNAAVSGKYTLYFMEMCARKEYLVNIDNYLDMYGYKTMRIHDVSKSIKVRPHWSYIKTVGCIITSSLPTEIANRICNITDNGIRFWVNGDEIGNFSLNNRG